MGWGGGGEEEASACVLGGVSTRRALLTFQTRRDRQLWSFPVSGGDKGRGGGELLSGRINPKVGRRCPHPPLSTFSPFSRQWSKDLGFKALDDP